MAYNCDVKWKATPSGGFANGNRAAAPFRWHAAPRRRPYQDGVTVGRLLKVRDRIGDLFNRDDLGWAGACRDCSSTFDPFLKPYAQGHLRVGLARIPGRFCLAAHADDPYPTGNESKRHARMKRAAQLWAISLGAADARDEVEGVGGRADVASVAANWIIECGNTRIGKLVSCIESEKAPLFTLIPYQRERRPSGQVRSLVGLHFAWSPQLTKAVRGWRERQALAAAEIMQAAYDEIFPSASVRPALPQGGQ